MIKDKTYKSFLFLHLVDLFGTEDAIQQMRELGFTVNHKERKQDLEYEAVPDSRRAALQAKRAQKNKESIPIEWLERKYPLSGVSGTEEYFRTAHAVRNVIEQWKKESMKNE